MDPNEALRLWARPKMTPNQPTYTPAEKRIIAKGNEMLSQAGMPPMTPEQQYAFIQKQRAKSPLTKLFGDWRVWTIGAGLAAWLVSRK